MFDVEKFIKMVEQKPALYDTRSKEYSHRDIRSKYWWAIGAQMYPTWSEFTKEEKRVKGKLLRELTTTPPPPSLSV